MIASERAIWVNCTTSKDWQRPPIGIIRVEKELISALATEFPGKVKLCYWNGAGFREHVPTTTRSDRLDRQIPTTFGEVNKHANIDHLLLGRWPAVRYIAQGLVSLLPRILARPLLRFLRSNSTRIRELIGVFSRWSPSSIIKTLFSREPESRSGTPVRSNSIFSRGDIFISAGADWDTGLVDSLYDEKIRTGLKVIGWCYDLIPIKFPQYMWADESNKFANYFISLAHVADQILCISNNTENDLLNFLKDSAAPIPATSVIYLGSELRDDSPEKTPELQPERVRIVRGQPFILFVSTFEKRKNHVVLYQAYRSLILEGKLALLPKLIIVGMNGWGVTELQRDLLQDPLTKDFIEHWPDVSDVELEELYQHAQFCVYPSNYEGWGLPVVEALSRGKVVVSSNGGSLQEAGGQFAIYCKPWDVVAWASAILKLSTNHAYREQLESKIISNYRPPSWNDFQERVGEIVRAQI